MHANWEIDQTRSFVSRLILCSYVLLNFLVGTKLIEGFCLKIIIKVLHDHLYPEAVPYI